MKKGVVYISLLWGFCAQATGFLEAEILRFAKVPTRKLDIKENIQFCKGDGIPLLLDFVRLKKRRQKEELPVAVFVHDNLISGNRKGEALALAKAAAMKGYLGVTIDYRLSGYPNSDLDPGTDRLQIGARFPAPVLDVRCAIRWIRSQAKVLGIHPGKIVVGGVGTGAYLALMAGLTGETRKMPKTGDLSVIARGTTNDVRAVINLGGATDTRLQYWFENTRRFQGQRQIASLVGASPSGKNKNLYKVSSPINFVGETSAPVFTFHGTLDYTFPHDAAVYLDEEMRRKKVPHTLMSLPGVGHRFKDRNGKVSRKAVNLVLNRAFEFMEISVKNEPTDILATQRKKKLKEQLLKEQKEDDWW